ncbi:MAG TPA: hypothetical protein VML55_23615, partial [Planctomycetaceae bacterium]|nr:hypothetical protein [Planctomycetaceae bacterium]
MQRKIAVAASAIAALVVFVSARGDAPVKVAEWISVEDLNALAGEQLKTLEQQLGDQGAYDERNEKDIPRTAGALACVAQAIAEHKDHSRLKVSAPALRDAALKLAKADAYSAAATALEQAQGAYAGTGAAGGPVEFDWTELIDVDSLMDEV